jgi:hypothetical protein
VGQLWESALHCGSLFDGTLFDTMPVLRRECGESLSEGVDVEESDRKGTDATAGAAKSAGNFTEKGGGCPLKPVVGFLIQRRRVEGCEACHGGSFHFDGKIDDEIALG